LSEKEQSSINNIRLKLDVVLTDLEIEKTCLEGLREEEDTIERQINSSETKIANLSNELTRLWDNLKEFMG